MINEMFKAALDYAARGWFVLPLNPASKVASCDLLAQIGFDWNTETKPDTETLTRWFEIMPDLNIGIRLRGSGLSVVDVDDMGKFILWMVDIGPLPDAPCVRTKRGCHYFFKESPLDQCGAINSEAHGYLGDFLTPNPPHWKPLDRAYVVAPPSRHPMNSHIIYEWLVQPDECALVQVPDWIRSAVYEPVAPHSWLGYDDKDNGYDYGYIPDCPTCGDEFWDGGTSCTCDYDTDEYAPDPGDQDGHHA